MSEVPLYRPGADGGDSPNLLLANANPNDGARLQFRGTPVHASSKPTGCSHMETLKIYKLGFNQDYYTFTLILLIQIVLKSNFLEPSSQIRSVSR